MSESLLNPSVVQLFGRVIGDIQIKSPEPEGAVAGYLDQQLHAPDASFARIYGFGYEGHYYILPGTALYLVHGPGQPAAEALGKLHLHTDDPGAATGTSVLSLPKDLVLWTYDKADFTIRLDMLSGQFDQLLVCPSGPVVGMSFHGMSVPGMSAQGMSVGGMSVPGMSAQGMSVGGMSVPGMNAQGMSVGGMSVQAVSLSGMSAPGMSARGMSAQARGDKKEDEV